MKHCIACKHGELGPGKTTFTAERDGLIVVIKAVPALICGTCEEEYLDEAVTKELLRQVDEMVKAGVEVAIREFEAA